MGAGLRPDAEEEKVDEEWGPGYYDARTHSLFLSFGQHLDDNPCWRHLAEVEKAMGAYAEACTGAHGSTEAELASLLPELRPEDKHGMICSLLLDVYYRMMGAVGLGVSYQPVPEGSRWHLQLGAWTVGDEDTPADLKPLVDVHRGLVVEALERNSFRILAEAGRAARETAIAFQQALNPDARLRKLLFRSTCELCP